MQRTLLTAALAAPISAQAATLGPEPVVWSHRGSSYLARENTLPACELSAEQGADGFELDLFPTAEGQLAVFHDPDLDRLTNVEDVFPLSRARDADGDGTPDTRFVADFTMDELRTLEVDADGREGRVAVQADPRNPAPQPEAHRIPTYAEALDLAAATGQRVLTEVKLTDEGDAAERAAVRERLIAEWVARGYTDADSPVVVQAFSDAFMAEIDARLEQTSLHVPTVQPNFDAAAREVPATEDPSLHLPSQEALEAVLGERHGDLDGVAVILDVLFEDRAFAHLLNPFGLDFAAAAEANGLDLYAWTLRIDDGTQDPAATADD